MPPFTTYNTFSWINSPTFPKFAVTCDSSEDVFKVLFSEISSLNGPAVVGPSSELYDAMLPLGLVER